MKDMNLINSSVEIDSNNSCDELISQSVQAVEKSPSLDTSRTNSNVDQEKLYEFYNLSRYYDLAFARDADSDIEFFSKCFKRYSNNDIKRILEPACGPGLFLEYAPKYGYSILGYDLNPSMVDFSKERLQKRNIPSHIADVVIGNMVNWKFDKKFDAAFICINSLGYIRKDEDIKSHFQNTSNFLNEGGIYIIELSCKCDDIKNEKRVDDTWYVNKEGIELEMQWAINWYDFENRIRHVDSKMKVNDNGVNFVIQESHDLRLWIYDELKEFARSTGFEIVGIFNQNYEEIPTHKPITGELGVLFFVLKKT